METLAELVLRDGPLNELDAVGWAIRLAKRVDQLHKLGVAHGGISAACVNLDGPSRNAPGQLADVRAAATMPGYHSPERHGGHGISPADDTWALAITLYFALTGSVPFAGETTEEIRHRITTTAAAPLAVFDVGDDDLQRILDSFLAKNIGQRVVTADRFYGALQQWHPDPQVGQLPPLEEEDGDTLSDDDDEEEEDVATVMRDFSEVQAHLDALRAQGKAPGLVDPTGGEPARRLDDPFAQAAGVPAAGGYPPQQAPAAGGPGRPPPPRRKQSTSVGGFNAPAPPPARAKQDTPMGGFGPSPGGAGVIHQPPPTTGPAFDIDDEDSDQNAATVMLDADAPDLSAAIEEALAQKKASRSAPPGWPAAPATAAAPSPVRGDSVEALLQGGYPAAPAPPRSQPRAAPMEAPVKEGSSLGTLLIVAVIVLVLVIAAVAVLYLRQRGIITFF